MTKKIRFEITRDGEIRAKTIGMDDTSCMAYIDVLEEILDAETVDSAYTEEFLKAQNIQTDEENLDLEEDLEIKGD